MNEYYVKLNKLITEKKFMDSQTFEELVEYICENIISTKLLDLVLKYFEIYPQQISCIPERLFIHLVSNTEEKLHPLILFLVSRHHDIGYNLNLGHLPIEKFAYLMSAFYQRIPLMICDPTLVIIIKNKIDAYKMLVDSPQWFNENEDLFLGLHAIEFDENECNELFTKLKTNWSILKITKAAVSFVDLVASKCNKELEFVQFLVEVLFSLVPENDNITWLSNQIISNLKLLEGTNCPIQISDWDTLAMKAVKYGLKEENPDYSFIRVFKSLIKKANVDVCIVKKSFELLAGYSQFSNIMLNRDSNQVQKEEVLKLIETLVKKEPSVMVLSHVPLYLCSYNASLSTTDQILLRILFHYEESSVPVSNYRPYLWGSFAISHYQVKNHLISKTLNSFPSTTEVLSYVPLKRIKATISKFPVDRILHIQKQKIIIPSKTKNSFNPSKMFDPAFFLPMISSLLATEAPLSIEKFNRSGCLSMVFACLGSNDVSMRLAAYHILILLRSHLFCRRAENLFWDHVLNWVSGGIQHLNTKSEPPQLPMIQALFLSRVVLAIANHEKPIDTTCCKLLLARPVAQLQHIPELKSFLSLITCPKEKQLQMHWFFEIIRDGLHSRSDWLILKEMDLLNLFMIVYRCGVLKDRIIILEIMKSVFSIEPATNGGTGQWATSLMVTLSICIKTLSNEEIILIFECLQVLSEFFSKDNIKIILNHGETTKVLTDDEVFECQSILKHGFNNIKIEETNSYIFLPTMIQILNN
ncbi:Hypothetical protein CINCED_3A025916 [Cinara cedri]|uniref:URB1 C-terminal domain-containing protein n=1 Tax=Cinara cedri TaxID=506608 RepID=A0A5E4NAK8_9HEMI|nr:Hypothetical protein CINCED_3A025916 [Cinara cedri]